jgi:aminoglycoside 3-N-acetyltransferase
MVHSSFKCVGPVSGGPQMVVDALVKAVGPKGTLLFPTYDFQSWTEERSWSQMYSKSKMGIISEFARQDPRFERSSHPVLSYAVYGRLAKRYLEDVTHSHGFDSVFEKLIQDDGVLLSVGALMSQNKGLDPNNVGYTMIHHSELTAGAPHRIVKSFRGMYMNSLGQMSRRTYTACVRHLDYVTQVSPAMRAMEDEGVVLNLPFGEAETHVGQARVVHAWIRKACLERPELFRVKKGETKE